MLKAIVIALVTFVLSASVAAAVVFGQSPTMTATPTATPTVSPSTTPSQAVGGTTDTRPVPSGAPNTGRAS